MATIRQTISPKAEIKALIRRIFALLDDMKATYTACSKELAANERGRRALKRQAKH